MKKLQNLSAIDTNTVEGRLLMGALVKISNESQSDKHPDEILIQCHETAEHMYKDAPPLLDEEPLKEYFFQQELSHLINRKSKENDSDTPDYILAEYLNDCLIAYEKTVKSRDRWFDVDMWKI